MRDEIYLILPINRRLYRYLAEVRGGMFGEQLLSMVLTGFLQNMLVRNFDLQNHLNDIDYIDGVYGTEALEFRREASIAITRMTIRYRNHFDTEKVKGINIYRATFSKTALRFIYEVIT